jgi:hypothetical protein
MLILLFVLFNVIFAISPMQKFKGYHPNDINKLSLEYFTCFDNSKTFK